MSKTGKSERKNSKTCESTTDREKDDRERERDVLDRVGVCEGVKQSQPGKRQERERVKLCTVEGERHPESQKLCTRNMFFTPLNASPIIRRLCALWTLTMRL